MKSLRRTWNGADAAALARELRAGAPAPEAIAPRVAELIERVRSGGDAALLELSEELDAARPESLRVPAELRERRAASVPEELRSALGVAAGNIRAVADAQRPAEPISTEPGAGQRVTISVRPVRAAGIYVPGGRAPYPSTALMGAIAARSAGCERVVIATPPAADGVPEAAVLAAAEIAGVDEVYAVGGAHGIAALAYGTESIDPVDVIAGPGGPWVQEAKLLVSRTVGIDGYAGPSELVVVSDGSAERRWLGLDLAAQAEHGDDGLLVAIALPGEDPAALARELEEIAAAQPSVAAATVHLIAAPSTDAAMALAEALAPEHLQLCCEGAAGLAARVRTAGCVLTGSFGATAFGDYAAGSNHVLPTGGAGRFTGPLGPGTFRRRISVVGMSPGSAVELAGVVETIARAEGFEVHAASAAARAEGAGGEG